MERMKGSGDFVFKRNLFATQQTPKQFRSRKPPQAVPELPWPNHLEGSCGSWFQALVFGVAPCVILDKVFTLSDPQSSHL